MQGFGLRFHHLGLALRQEKHALGFLGGMGYALGERIYDPEQNVHLRLCSSPAAPRIEFLKPLNMLAMFAIARMRWPRARATRTSGGRSSCGRRGSRGSCRSSGRGTARSKRRASTAR